MQVYSPKTQLTGFMQKTLSFSHLWDKNSFSLLQYKSVIEIDCQQKQSTILELSKQHFVAVICDSKESIASLSDFLDVGHCSFSVIDNNLAQNLSQVSQDGLETKKQVLIIPSNLFCTVSVPFCDIVINFEFPGSIKDYMNRFNRLKHENCSATLLTFAEKKDEKTVMKIQKSVGDDVVVSGLSSDCFSTESNVMPCDSAETNTSEKSKVASIAKRRVSKKLPVISVEKAKDEAVPEASVSGQDTKIAPKKRTVRSKKPTETAQDSSVSVITSQEGQVETTAPSFVPEFAPLTQNNFIPVPRSAARSLRKHLEKDDEPVRQTKPVVHENKTVIEHDLKTLHSPKNEERPAFKPFVAQPRPQQQSVQDDASKITRITRNPIPENNLTARAERKPTIRTNSTNNKRHTHRPQKPATVHSFEKHQQDRTDRSISPRNTGGDRSPSSFAESGFIPEFLLRPVFLSKAS